MHDELEIGPARPHMPAGGRHPTTPRFAGIGRRLSDETGAAMVEFALVATVLLLLVFGILYFGRYINYATDQTHLANEAARWAAVNLNPGSTNGRSCGSLQTCVQVQADSNELRTGGTNDVPNPAQVCITFPNGTSNVGDPVQAKVTAKFQFLPLFNLAPITVSESATMRLEQAPSNYSAGCSS